MLAQPTADSYHQALSSILFGFWGLGRGYGEDSTGEQKTPKLSLCKGQLKLEVQVQTSAFKVLPKRQVTALGKITANIFIILAKHFHHSQTNQQDDA